VVLYRQCLSFIHNLQDLRLRPCGHQDRPLWHLVDKKYSSRLSFRVPLCDSQNIFLPAVYKSQNSAYKRWIRIENL